MKRKRLLCSCIVMLSLIIGDITFVPEAVPAEKPAWQVDWDKTVAAAKQEGKLVIYTTGGSDLKGLIRDGLKKKFNISADFVSGRGAELAAKIAAERRAGLYLGDVYIGGATTMITTLKPAGDLAPLPPQLVLPEVVDPKYYFDNRLPYTDKENKYVLVYGPAVANTVAVNTNLVKPREITAYKDLLHPRWEGKIVMFDPTIPGTANEWFYVVAKKLGLDFHHQLVKQKPMVTRDKRLPGEWLSRGKSFIALASSKESFAEFKRSGAPIEWVPTEEVTYLSGTGALALYDKAPHPHAAKVFINWLMTRETLTKWSQESLMATARRDVPQDFLEPESRRDPNKQYFDLNTEESTIEGKEYDKLAVQIYKPLLR